MESTKNTRYLRFNTYRNKSMQKDSQNQESVQINQDQNNQINETINYQNYKINQKVNHKLQNLKNNRMILVENNTLQYFPLSAASHQNIYQTKKKSPRNQLQIINNQVESNHNKLENKFQYQTQSTFKFEDQLLQQDTLQKQQNGILDQSLSSQDNLQLEDKGIQGIINFQGISANIFPQTLTNIIINPQNNSPNKQYFTNPINIQFQNCQNTSQDKQPIQIVSHSSKSPHFVQKRALSQVDFFKAKQLESNQEYAKFAKRKASYETSIYNKIKDLTSELKKQKSFTERFLRRTKKKKQKIEKDIKEGLIHETNLKRIQEKQTLDYIIKEQKNLARNPQEVKKMISEAIRQNSIKNLMDKLKIEKATANAAAIISKIKKQPHHSHKYFTDLVKDSGSLAQPLSVLAEFAYPVNEIEQINKKPQHSSKETQLYFSKKREEWLNLKDNLEIDFFKYVNPEELNRNKADTFYEIRSQAMSTSQAQLNKAYQNHHLTNPLLTSLGNMINNFSKLSKIQQKIGLLNTDSIIQSGDHKKLINRKNELQTSKEIHQEHQDIMQSINSLPKRKQLINGGIQYEYVNELGFKVRVQNPPNNILSYQKVLAFKQQEKKEDVFFKKLVKKANRIANEIQVNNRITDHSHKQQMKSFKCL